MKYIIIPIAFAAIMAGKGTPASQGKETFSSARILVGVDSVTVCPAWYAEQFPESFDTLKPFKIIELEP